MPFKNKKKQLEYQRQWTSDRRKEFFKDKKCVQCGSIEKLELDHIDPKLKISHRIWNLCELKRLSEIAKCQVLCKECHKKKTYSQQEHKATHGTQGMYKYRKCRCKICNDGNAYRVYKWRKNKLERNNNMGLKH